MSAAASRCPQPSPRCPQLSSMHLCMAKAVIFLLSSLPSRTAAIPALGTPINGHNDFGHAVNGAALGRRSPPSASPPHPFLQLLFLPTFSPQTAAMPAPPARGDGGTPARASTPGPLFPHSLPAHPGAAQRSTPCLSFPSSANGMAAVPVSPCQKAWNSRILNGHKVAINCKSCPCPLQSSKCLQQTHCSPCSL